MFFYYNYLYAELIVFYFIGTCMYTVQSHDGAVLGLTCSASYVISIGQDDKICVWDRFYGHQLNSIQIVSIFLHFFLNLFL